MEPNSVLKNNLVRALRRAGEPRLPLTVATYRPRFFRLVASLRIGGPRSGGRGREGDPPAARPVLVRTARLRAGRDAQRSDRRDAGRPRRDCGGPRRAARARVKEGLRAVLRAAAPEPRAAGRWGGAADAGPAARAPHGDRMSLDLETIYRLLPAFVRVRDGSRASPAGPAGDRGRAGGGAAGRPGAALRRPVHRDVRGVGGPLHRRPGRRARRAAVQGRALPARAGRRHHRRPAPEGRRPRCSGWPPTSRNGTRPSSSTSSASPPRNHVKHVRPGNVIMPAVRKGGSRWTTSARRSTRPRGRSKRGGWRRDAAATTSQNVGIFLWRLDAHRLSQVPPHAVGGQRFVFDPLGWERPLYARHEDDPHHVARPISRRALHADLLRLRGRPRPVFASTAWGAAWTSRWTGPRSRRHRCAVATCRTGRAANGREAPGDRYVVDPVRGRLMVPSLLPASARLRVTFHHGFPTQADLGGGEYARDRTVRVQPAVGPGVGAIDDPVGARRSGG